MVIQVCGHSKTMWTPIFGIIVIGNMIFLYVCLRSDNFMKQDWEFFSGPFNGGLIVPGIVPVIDGDKICSSNDNDNYKDCYNNCPRECDFWKTWYDAGVSFIICDAFAIGLNGLCIIALTLDYYKISFMRKYINILVPGFILIAATLLHVIGLIVWSSKVELKFTKQSSQWPYKSAVSVQAQSGTTISIIACIWLGFATFFLLFIGRLIRIQEKSEPNYSQERGQVTGQVRGGQMSGYWVPMNS